MTSASSAAQSRSKRAWVTLITSVDYLPGLLVLDHSLRRTSSRYPLVALYTDALPAAGHAVLDRRSIPKRKVKQLSPSQERSYGNDPRFADVWTKLSIYELVEYDRIVLLDSDMLVRQNMDELMDLELDDPQLHGTGDRVFAATHACVCNPLKKPHYPPDWVPANCAFYKQHADPDRAQTEGVSNLDSFGSPNSGLVVINPCEGALQQIEAKLQTDATARYNFPDQELLGDVFRGRWVTLPYVYNALKPMRGEGVHDRIWRDDRVKNVHYILNPKPWEERPEQAGELSRWWHEVNAERLEKERQAGAYDGTGDTSLLH